MKTGIYKNYKGNFYEVLGSALDTATQEKTVLYKALYECRDLEKEYGLYPVFTRSYKLFCAAVEYEGKIVPRFEFIKDVEHL